MKKALSLVISALLAASLTLNVSTPLMATADMRQPGDVNDDGLVNIEDIMLIRAHIFGETELAGDDLAAADLDFNREINLMDIRLVRDIIFGAQPECFALYKDFLESREWCWMEDDEGYGFRETNFNITEYKIFDFDGDGVPELWLWAYYSSDFFFQSIYGFYTILNGSVVQLLHTSKPYPSSGFWISTKYNKESGNYVIEKEGKTYDYNIEDYIYETTFYNMANGKLEVTEIFGGELLGFTFNEKATYILNQKIVSYEAFKQAGEKYEWPMDEYFVLHREWR